MRLLCRLCKKRVAIPGLDYNLCSADCGWVAQSNTLLLQKEEKPTKNSRKKKTKESEILSPLVVKRSLPAKNESTKNDDRLLELISDCWAKGKQVSCCRVVFPGEFILYRLKTTGEIEPEFFTEAGILAELFKVSRST